MHLNKKLLINLSRTLVQEANEITCNLMITKQFMIQEIKIENNLNIVKIQVHDRL